ncbi:MAG: HlyD family efflux transporter periplasmic adaptor subunit [Gammaproteobacteria bacterium]|nr:HlyD family efflux transporter periplasmic adaptor subunit [Gammaproteobacteria bacterium]
MNSKRLNLRSNLWRTVVILTASLFTVITSGCDQTSADGVLTMEVVARNFTADIPAVGELEASNFTNIKVPSGLKGVQSLAWIMDNFSEVKAGDVVVRMDATRESYNMALEQFNVDRLGFEEEIQAQKDQTIAKDINAEIEITASEQQLAKRFFSEDERVYTKIEIIDQMRDQEYLGARSRFYNWNSKEHSTQAQAEQALIKLKQSGPQEKINRYASNLKQMEITAPHDGILVIKPGWHGALPVAGDLLGPGMTIGTLPDTTKMQAKLYVLESEALGLTLGKPVTLYLDAYPQMPISGTVAQLDSLAKPRQQNSPVNYFEMKVAIDKTIPELMQPGRQVKAKVHALDLQNVITVPNQALFQKSGNYWVYLRTSAGFVKQTVKPGKRSLNRTVITEGLTAGDTIALTRPPKRSRV